MDIKCKTNPYYFVTPSPKETISSRGAHVRTKAIENSAVRISAGLCEDIIVKSPVASKSATGLLALGNKIKNKFSTYIKNYKKNIMHTYDHKIVFALVEKQLFGKYSIDSLTHDLDKLILYILGFPKSFVSKFHRNNSVHHTESGKQNN